MSDVNVTVAGHVGNDPAIYRSAGGTEWTSFRVASTRRVRDPRTGEWGDGPTLWFTVKAFGERAHNVTQSLRKGTPVVVTGRLAHEEWEATRQVTGADGQTREVTERRCALTVENATVSVDVSRGVARYSRVVSTEVVPDGAPTGAAPAGDPWAVPPAGLGGPAAGEAVRATVGAPVGVADGVDDDGEEDDDERLGADPADLEEEADDELVRA